MARKNRLKLKREGLVVNATVYSEKLTPEDVGTRPEIVTRDEQGRPVERQTYDKATGEPLEEGYGFRWVTGEGEEVGDDVVRYIQVDDDEREVDLYEPTLGRERTLEPIDWVAVGELGEFLVDRTYEVWAEDEPDVAQLYELAEYVRAYGMAPVVPVVLRRSPFQSWGIVTPQFYEDTFSLVMRVTEQRVRPRHPMPVVPEVVEEGTERRRADQESPFR